MFLADQAMEDEVARRAASFGAALLSVERFGQVVHVTLERRPNVVARTLAKAFAGLGRCSIRHTETKTVITIYA